jgi:hypothetical protein
MLEWFDIKNQLGGGCQPVAQYIYIYMLAMRGVRDRGAKRQVPTVQYIFACMLHWSSSIYTNQSLER